MNISDPSSFAYCLPIIELLFSFSKFNEPILGPQTRAETKGLHSCAKTGLSLPAYVPVSAKIMPIFQYLVQMPLPFGEILC